MFLLLLKWSTIAGFTALLAGYCLQRFWLGPIWSLNVLAISGIYVSMTTGMFYIDIKYTTQLMRTTK